MALQTWMLTPSTKSDLVLQNSLCASFFLAAQACRGLHIRQAAHLCNQSCLPAPSFLAAMVAFAAALQRLLLSQTCRCILLITQANHLRTRLSIFASGKSGSGFRDFTKNMASIFRPAHVIFFFFMAVCEFTSELGKDP